MSSLTNLFRAEVTFTKKMSHGVREYIFNVDDIKHYYNAHADVEATENARAKGENISNVYYTLDGDCGCEYFQQDTHEIKQLIKDAEDERIARLQKARLQII